MSTPSLSASVAAGGAGPHVEADDDRLRGGGEHDVGLGDRADAGVDDAYLDLVVLDLSERIGERLETALDVGLDDQVEVADLALLDAREEVVEGERALRVPSSSALMPVGALAGQGCAPRARS